MEAFGKVGILMLHERTVMNQYAKERADCYKRNYLTTDS